MQKIKAYLILAAACVLLAGCDWRDRPHEGSYEHVFIYCGLGYNNLSNNLMNNFNDIRKGILPGLSSDKAFLAFCHNTSTPGNYSTPNPPRLIRIYRNSEGKNVADTLKTYDNLSVSATKDALHAALEDIRTLFPSQSYGMLFSSHGSGWLPANYDIGAETRGRQRTALPQPEHPWPETKAIGNQFVGDDNNIRWIELRDFVDALPMKMDYLILDNCLSGTVEVAYELKDVCDYLVVSPTEVLSKGMIYKTLSWDIFAGGKADLLTYSTEYFNLYNSQSGSERSATVALVDCKRLDALAEAFGRIVSAHRDAIDPRLRSSVQKYFYGSSRLRFFYDLRDYAEKLGATEAELGSLDAALDACVLYHAQTPFFFDLPLERCCGLSVYIPDPARPQLNDYYKTFAWNRKVMLVE